MKHWLTPARTISINNGQAFLASAVEKYLEGGWPLPPILDLKKPNSQIAREFTIMSWKTIELGRQGQPPSTGFSTADARMGDPH